MTASKSVCNKTNTLRSVIIDLIYHHDIFTVFNRVEIVNMYEDYYGISHKPGVMKWD